MIRFVGLSKPLLGHLKVFVEESAIEIAPRELVHRIDNTLISRPLIQNHGATRVFRHSIPVCVAFSNLKHGYGIALSCGQEPSVEILNLAHGMNNPTAPISLPIPSQ